MSIRTFEYGELREVERRKMPKRDSIESCEVTGSGYEGNYAITIRSVDDTSWLMLSQAEKEDVVLMETESLPDFSSVFCRFHPKVDSTIGWILDSRDFVRFYNSDGGPAFQSLKPHRSHFYGWLGANRLLFFAGYNSALTAFELKEDQKRMTEVGEIRSVEGMAIQDVSVLEGGTFAINVTKGILFICEWVRTFIVKRRFDLFQLQNERFPNDPRDLLQTFLYGTGNSSYLLARLVLTSPLSEMSYRKEYASWILNCDTGQTMNAIEDRNWDELGLLDNFKDRSRRNIVWRVFSQSWQFSDIKLIIRDALGLKLSLAETATFALVTQTRNSLPDERLRRIFDLCFV